MKSHIVLWQELAEELGQQCGTNTDRDVQTVIARVEREGSAFLGITLPDFGKAFERSLAVGSATPLRDQGFKLDSAGIPRFLSGFLGRVFDTESGALLDEPDVACIQAVRQLTLLYGKVNEDSSVESRDRAFAQYVQTDQEVRVWEVDKAPTVSSDIVEFRRLASLLFGNLFDAVNREVDQLELVPKHGPGSTSDRLYGNFKYGQNEWTERLNKVFPIGDYLIPNYRYWESLDDVTILPMGLERPVKVITVPKTMRTPRIIAIEPTCMQYAQQAVLDSLNRNLKDLQGSILGARFVDFEDQTKNHQLALIGSVFGDLATLDMSEASDRVPLLLVEEMLRPWPALLEAVQASRSLTADVPGVGIIPISKFASMGSALCFPMETFVFTTIVAMGIMKHRGITKANHKDLMGLTGSLRVFGDDIVAPTDSVPSVIHLLEEVFPFKVNHSKSFWTGKFRESCGKEYYDGEDVSIVRVRRNIPESRADADGIISFVSFRNLLYKAGFWTTTRKVDQRIQNLLGYFPVVGDDSPALGRHSFLDGFEIGRVSADTHQPQVRAWVGSGVPPKSIIDGISALMKCFLKGDEPFEDSKHLLRSGRPRHVSLKRRWVPAY